MPKSVLVADDSVTMRKVIGMIFAHEDFSLTLVDNGLDAIQRAREMRPDVVLADCMMPGKNGYDVCQELKSDPSTQHIPVMLLAGTFEPFDENRARAARADGHVVKPFESQGFLDKVKALVGMPAGTPVAVGYGAVSTGAPLAANLRATTPGGAANPMMGNNPRPMPGPQGMQGRPPPAGVPPGTVPGMRSPAMGAAPGVPMGRPPPPGLGASPGMPMGRPPMQGGIPQGSQAAFPRPPGPGMPGAPGMPMGRPPMQGGIPQGSQAAFPRPPGGNPMPGAVPPRRDPFGLGGAPQGAPPGGPQYRPPPPQQAPQPNPLSLDEPRRGDGGEAVLRDALSKASREVIEKIAWEVVPQLAETIIRQELDRLIKDREAKN